MKVFGRLRTGMCAVFWCGKNIAWKIIDGDIKIMKTEEKLLFEEFCNRCINEVERIPQSSIKMELKLLMQGYTRKEIIEKVSNEYGSSIKRYALTKDIKYFRKIFHEVFGF